MIYDIWPTLGKPTSATLTDKAPMLPQKINLLWLIPSTSEATAKAGQPPINEAFAHIMVLTKIQEDLLIIVVYIINDTIVIYIIVI